MSESNVSSNGGMGLAGWLTVLFVGLKLTGFISWSWWWVLSPLWIGFGLIGAILVIGLVIGLVIIAIANRK